ncbi:MAG: hypothetical protein IKT00_07635 [Prevotella sp.]|nr:hypothetical protein [Prevotella sp.]
MTQTRLFVITFIAFICTIVVNGQNELNDMSLLRDCDLLFHVSMEDNAITSVTEGTNLQKIDHVSIFLYREGRPYVIEAIDKGVVITPLDSVLVRSGYHLVGRVRGSLDKERTLHRAEAFLGRSYDHMFLSDNTAIYCSELVELSYVLTNGKKVFNTIPMTFTSTDGVILPYWQSFYAEHGMEVPEGQPGTNPGELSRRKCVKIKYVLKGAQKRTGSKE